MKHCPNCGKDLFAVKTPASPNTPESRPNHNATINPWANPVAGKSFKLKPVAWENEHADSAELSFVGETTELNRDNTDAANNTITSKVQAIISFADGKWSIVDQSAQNTTFVYAGRKMELEDGDIIMLGNRKFIFKVE